MMMATWRGIAPGGAMPPAGVGQGAERPWSKESWPWPAPSRVTVSLSPAMLAPTPAEPPCGSALPTRLSVMPA